MLWQKGCMLECYVFLTAFAHNICLHGYILFIVYLFNPNTKYQDMYRIPHKSAK